jgi:hypothetical protein
MRCEARICPKSNMIQCKITNLSAAPTTLARFTLYYC